MSKTNTELVPIRGPELFHAIIRFLSENLKLGVDASITQLPVKQLAEKLRDSEGFVEFEIKQNT